MGVHVQCNIDYMGGGEIAVVPWDRKRIQLVSPLVSVNLNCLSIHPSVHGLFFDLLIYLSGSHCVKDVSTPNIKVRLNSLFL